MKGAASGSVAGHASPTRLAGASTASTSNAHHPPYSIEVCGITPVSISLLWSLRPLPLSAIPRSSVRQQHKQLPFSARAPSIQQHGQPASTKASAAHPPRTTPLQRVQAAEAPGSSVGSTSSVTATRSPNRRVTKVSIRNISPAQRGTSTAKSTNKSSAPAAAARRDSTDWPSDDGATAVGDEDDDNTSAVHDELDTDADRTLDHEHVHRHSHSVSQDDDLATPSEVSDDQAQSSARPMDSVGVTVNGVPWSHVVVGDSSAEEAFIIVYGLQPGREYDVLLSVENKSGGISVTTAAPTAEETDDKNISGTDVAAVRAQPRFVDDRTHSTESSTASQSGHRIKRTHTPPMQDTEAAATTTATADGSPEMNSTATLITTSTGSDGTVTSVASLQAALRKARRDASRAESALRNEIEAIKRGLERMSDVDHRSKQKLLALQENIRQATSQAKEIDEEATAVENERELWEEREKEKNDELDSVRTDVEEKVRTYQASIKGDCGEIDAAERELQQATKSVEEKKAMQEKVEKEQIVEAEKKLSQLHEEIENTLRRPMPVQPMPAPTAPFYAAATAAASAQQHNQGLNAHFVPPHAQRSGAGRGGSASGGKGGTGNASRGSGRGGHQHHGHGQPGTGRRNQNRQNVRYPHHYHPTNGQYYGAAANGADEHSMTNAQVGFAGASPYQSPLSSNTGATAASSHSPMTSMLNPNNPEFIPSASATAHAPAASASPLAALNATVPSNTYDQSPTTARFPVHAYVGEQEAPRRASTSHLELPGLSSSTNMSFGGNGMAAGGGDTWLATGNSPWASSTSNAALTSSPQLGHDIWRSPATSSHGLPTLSPQLTQTSQLGPAPAGNHHASLRQKTSIPFGLNASLLRGSTHSPYVHSRLGGGGGDTRVSAIGQPSATTISGAAYDEIDAIHPSTGMNDASTAAYYNNTGGGSIGEGRLRSLAHPDSATTKTAAGSFSNSNNHKNNNSAPVSPVQPPPNASRNMFADFT